MAALVLAGVPATMAAFILAPSAAAIGFVALPKSPALGALYLFLALSSMVALSGYWLLAARTIRGQPFRLGWSFGIACAAGLLDIVLVFGVMSMLLGLLVVVPILAATVWCLYEQHVGWPPDHGA
jgi:hypothetical protein